MTPIQNAYINALLADASYVERVQAGAIDATKFEDRQTTTQANYLAANFTVKTSHQSPTGGFDAVVWEGKLGTEFAGQVFVSMRGTQEVKDLLDDVVLAVKGIPADQIVEMTNWWLRITTPPNALARQIEIVIDYDNSTPPIEIGSHFAFTGGVPGQGTPETLGITSIAGVNGHSLGGYLATAFTRLFGNQAGVQSVNTFNSAGFSNAAAININNSYNQIAGLLGLSGSFAAVGSIQKNYFGVNGVEFTTNSAADIGIPGFRQYGQRVDVYQENVLGGSLGPFNNHSMYKLTDYLAVGNLLAKLAPSLSTDTLNTLIKAGSNDMKASYEGVLDGLRKMLIGTSVAATPAGDVGDSNGSRPIFHANLKTLQDSATFQALAGKLTIALPSGNLATTAKTDFAAFLSLNALSPVALSTSDAGAQAALQQVHPALHTAWQADKNARQYGDTSKAFDYSDNWYADRAALLLNLVTAHIKDAPANPDGYLAVRGTQGGDTNTRYIDIASGKLLQENNARTSPSTAVNKYVMFGSEAANEMNGGSREDRLYGGSGKDTLLAIVGHYKNNSCLRTYPLAWSTKTLLKAGEKRCSMAEENVGRHRIHSKRCVTLSSIFKSKSKLGSRPVRTCASSYRNESELKLQGAAA